MRPSEVGCLLVDALAGDISSMKKKRRWKGKFQFSGRLFSFSAIVSRVCAGVLVKRGRRLSDRLRVGDA
jgi:hypothetical protein